MYLLTVLSAMLMPSLSNSPWMRGAPQVGFSRHIQRIRSRTSRGSAGLPGWPRRIGACLASPWLRSVLGVEERATPKADGPVESTWGALVRSVEERRFGAGEPGSLTQGQRANARSKTRWQGVSLEK